MVEASRYPGCGSEIQAADRHCRSCGTVLSERLPILRYKLSPKRVVVMSILSFGIYLWYWFYLTWKQYRDHTGERAYPVWHALALSVPIYGLFRTHAHMRSYKELMAGTGVPTTIAVGWTVFAVAIVSLLVYAGFTLGLGEMTAGDAGVVMLMYITSVSVVAVLLTQLQDNLNRYWDGLPNTSTGYVPVGMGETTLVIIGLISWALSLLALFSESYRAL